jgi:hypothetical protein
VPRREELRAADLFSRCDLLTQGREVSCESKICQESDFPYEGSGGKHERGVQERESRGTVVCQENVDRFDVAMNHIGGVEMRESQANLRMVFRHEEEGKKQGEEAEREARRRQGEEAGRET